MKITSRRRSERPRRVARIARAALAGAVLAAPAFARASPATTSAAGAGDLRASEVSVPLLFEPNVGQGPAHAEHLARAPGQALVLVGGSAALALSFDVGPPGSDTERADRSRPRGPRARVERRVAGRPDGSRFARRPDAGREAGRPDAGRHASSEAEASRRTETVVIRLLGALNPPGRPEGLRRARSHYLLGADPAGWKTDVPSYERVRHREAWPGIDVVWHGARGRLEVDFELAAGAEPHAIGFRVEGGTCLHLESDGALGLAMTEGPALRFPPPIAWQDAPTGRRPVGVRYELSGSEGRDVSFQLAGVDRTLPLTIDPVVAWSTFLGGSGSQQARGLAIADDGGILVCGTTTSDDFPVVDPLQPYAGSSGTGLLFGDAFVTKLTPDGSDVVFSTWLGGPAGDSLPPSGVSFQGGDQAEAIAVDAAGNILVVGMTASAAFPTTAGAFQEQHGGCDGSTCTAAFVAKLDPTGSNLVWSTYLGGYHPRTPVVWPPDGQDLFADAFFDRASDVAVDSAGVAWVSGGTLSEAFPLRDPVQPIHGGYDDAFLSAFAPDGSLLFSTFLGGPESEDARGVAVGPTGRVFVAGLAGRDFPTTAGAYQMATGGSGDAFVAAFDPGAPPTLAWSTLLGGTGPDQARGVAVGSDGHPVVVGRASSADWPVLSAFQPSKVAQWEGFVTKVDSGGGFLHYSTWLGGSSYDEIHDVVVDAAGRAIVAGDSSSFDFPLADASPLHAGCDHPDEGICAPDAAVAIVQPDGASLCYSELHGSTRSELARAVALHPSGDIVVAGWANADFPTSAGAFQETALSSSNAFVLRLTGVACP